MRCDAAPELGCFGRKHSAASAVRAGISFLPPRLLHPAALLPVPYCREVRCRSCGLTCSFTWLV